MEYWNGELKRGLAENKVTMTYGCGVEEYIEGLENL